LRSSDADTQRQREDTGRHPQFRTVHHGSCLQGSDAVRTRGGTIAEGSGAVSAK
jgi:hypothetical protein